MQEILTKHTSKLKLLGLSLLVAALSACSTSSITQPTSNSDDHYDYVLTVDIAASDSQTEVERNYEGEAVVFRPEAGFAVLGLKHGEFSTLSSDAETNIDAVYAPAVAAGNDSWAGGNDSWAGGNDSWAGGNDSWAGGADFWTSSNTQIGALANNSDEFAQINLGLGQELSLNLGAGVVVAVLDTGVDLTHPALKNALAPTHTWKDYVDGDSYPNDDPASNDSESNAGYGHGTAVTGIILQMAPRAKIMPIRVLAPNGGGDFTDIAAGIDWAVQQGAHIINLSLGSTTASATINTMLNYAASQGVYVIASSGNTGDSHITHPASAAFNPTFGSYVVSVGSVDVADNKSSFSTYGTNLEIVAPGEQIYTFGPNSTTLHATGTSFAAPMIAGTLALGLSDSLLSVNDTVSGPIAVGDPLGAPVTYPSDGTSFAVLNIAANLTFSADSSIYTGQNQAYLNLLGQGRLDVVAFIMTLVGTEAYY